MGLILDFKLDRKFVTRKINRFDLRRDYIFDYLEIPEENKEKIIGMIKTKQKLYKMKIRIIIMMALISFGGIIIINLF